MLQPRLLAVHPGTALAFSQPDAVAVAGCVDEHAVQNLPLTVTATH